MTARFARFLFVLLAAMAALASAPARARADGWVSLDGSPEGTAAQVTFDGFASDAGETHGHVVIHGFWRTSMQGPGPTTFDDIVVPGLSNFATPGAPRLPVIVFDVGIMTGAADALLELDGVTSELLPGYLVWPATEEPPFQDGATGTFIQDLMIYGGSTPWPPQPDAFLAAPVGPALLPPAARVSLRPFRWNPATLELEVLRAFDFALFHGGSPPVVMELPPAELNYATSLYFNNGVLAPHLLQDVNDFKGSFLFVVPPGYESAIAPLVLQKKARGFAVTQIAAPPGSTCTSVRSAITAWRSSTSAFAEHFCILVGNHEQIPWCLSEDLPGYPMNVLWSDRPYAVLDDLGDADKDVLVGRLPGTTPQQVADMVQRTLFYEDYPTLDANHTRIVLVADKGQEYLGHSGKHLQEVFRTLPRAFTPLWATQYGEEPGVTNATLDATLETGASVLSYLGEHLDPGWYHWNLANEEFYDPQVAALANGPFTPVLLAPTAALNHPEMPPVPSMPYLGTAFLRHGSNGAVASFAGDGVLTPGLAGLQLHQFLFDELLDHGNRVLGHAIAGAEWKVASILDPKDLFSFVLFGDPQLTVRLTTASLFEAPDPNVAPCPGGGCTEFHLDLVKVEGGGPLPNAKVSVYKPASAGPRAARAGANSTRVVDQPEVIASTYTDVDGSATLELPELAPGTLYYAVETTDGAACFDSLRLSGEPVGVGPSALAPFALTARPSIVREATMLDFGRPLANEGRLEVFDTLGRRIGATRLAAGTTSVRWTPAGTDGARLAAGIYLARITDGTTSKRCRLVVP